MTVLDVDLRDELVGRLGRYGSPQPGDERLEVAFDEWPVTPELVLVAPPEVASAARDELRDPEPFDAWLARVRAAEAEVASATAAAPDWEHPLPASARRLPGVVFALVCVLNAVVPVVLLALDAHR